MKILVLSIIALLVGAVVYAQDRQREVAPASAPAEPTIERIRLEVPEHSAIRSFVAWLQSARNVSELSYAPIVYLTSYPPQQRVTFRLGKRTYRLGLLVSPHEMLALTSEESSPVR